MSAADRIPSEDDVRRIVREEIAKAFGMLAREASHQNGYDTDIIEGSALSALERSAEGAAARVTCEHESYVSWTSFSGTQTHPVCRACGEPEPELENPFEGDRPTGVVGLPRGLVDRLTRVLRSTGRSDFNRLAEELIREFGSD